MNIKFFLKNPKQGKNKILIRVRIGRAIDLTLATKESVNYEDWDSANGCLLEQYSEFNKGKLIIKRDAETKCKIAENKMVNYRLKELEKLIDESYKSTNLKIDRCWLQNLMYPKIEESENKNISFVDYFDIFLESRGTTISKEYVTKIKSIKEIILRYMDYKKIKHLPVVHYEIKK